MIRYNSIKGWMIKDGSDIILKNGEIMRNFSKNGTWILASDNIKITDKMIFKSNFNIFKCSLIQGWNDIFVLFILYLYYISFFPINNLYEII